MTGRSIRKLALACLIAGWSNVSNAAELELEGLNALSAPFCVDTRIASERKRAKAPVRTDSLAAMLKCKRVYRWPLSVRPDQAMVASYARKLKRFGDNTVVIWCTQGVRTSLIHKAIADTMPNLHSVKGGTHYLARVLAIEN